MRTLLSTEHPEQERMLSTEHPKWKGMLSTEHPEWKGMLKDGSGWAYGALVKKTGKVFIEQKLGPYQTKRYEVLESSLGRNTYKQDKHGDDVFEGDIVVYYLGDRRTDGCRLYTVVWDAEHEVFKLRRLGTPSLEESLFAISLYEIDGNIHK